MKVTELFEAYTPPVKNRKLGFSERAKIPLGDSKEWLKTFGATATDIEQALRVVRQSAEYRALTKLMTDESTERHHKNGSLMFVGSFDVSGGGGKVRSKRFKVTIQSSGKIDETAPNDWHRYPIASGKPRIVPGDAVQSIVKSMTPALEKVVATMERRKTAAAKEIEKAKKAELRRQLTTLND